MAKFLTLDERKSFRESISKLTEFNAQIENSLRKKKDIPLHIRQKVYSMTNCSDMGEAYDVLLDMKEYTQQQYLSQIKDMAPKSLSAFAEYMNPDEPPARHHEFLIEHLEAIEQGDLQRMLLSMPPGHAKPLTLDAPVMMADGSFKPLGDVEVGDEVVSHMNRGQEVTAVHDQGELEVWEINTKSGRTIRCAGDHPFFTTRGWINASELDNHDMLIPSTIGLEDHKHTIEEFALAGAMFAVCDTVYDEYDPNCVNFYFDHSLPRVGESLIEMADRCGIKADFAFRGRAGNCPSRVYFDKSANHTLHNLGIADAIFNKTIPAWVYGGSTEQIYTFLCAMWRTVYTERRRTYWTESHRVYGTFFETIEQAEAVEQLMWRIGINASKRPYEYKARTKKKGYNHYANTITQFNYAVFLPKTEAAKFFVAIEDITNAQNVLPRFPSTMVLPDRVTSTVNTGKTESMRCLTVDLDHSFTVFGLVVHNSTYASHLFPAWYFGRNPKKRYLQAGHTQKFCEDELGKRVRNYIKSEPYHEIFPEISIAHDTSAAGTWAIAKYNGKYVVRAIGQAIAGLRGHIAGVDDPYPTLKEAESATYRQQVVDWFNADFKSRLLPNSPLFVVATRWHPDDLCGVLEEEGKKGTTIPYTIINLPVYCVDPETDPLNRAYGELLWPYFSKAYMSDMKAGLSNKNWNSLYMGNPIPESGNMLKPEWINYWTVLPEGNKSVTISVDSANKATERSDFTVITVWYQYGNDHYLVDLVRRRMEYTEMTNTVELYARKHGADRIIIEDAGTGSQYHIQATNTEHVPPCPVIAVKTNGNSKEFRFDAALPQFEAGHVYFKKDADWLGELEKELFNFPSVTHDDQVDSVSHYLIYRRPKPMYGSVKMNATARAAKQIETDSSKLVRQGKVDMNEAEDAE